MEGLERLLREHLIYYNHERTHQGLDGHRIPLAGPHDDFSKHRGEVKCRSRLGNTLNFYYREAV